MNRQTDRQTGRWEIKHNFLGGGKYYYYYYGTTTTITATMY